MGDKDHCTEVQSCDERRELQKAWQLLRIGCQASFVILVVRKTINQLKCRETIVEMAGRKVERIPEAEVWRKMRREDRRVIGERALYAVAASARRRVVAFSASSQTE